MYPHSYVTVADDLTEMTHSRTEMLVMVSASAGFANGARFVIHPTKSCILTYWDECLQHQDDSYIMNGFEMSQVQHSTHLGIHRDSNKKVNNTENVNLGRRTAYSLMDTECPEAVCEVNYGQLMWFPVWSMVWRYSN